MSLLLFCACDIYIVFISFLDMGLLHAVLCCTLYFVSGYKDEGGNLKWFAGGRGSFSIDIFDLFIQWNSGNSLLSNLPFVFSGHRLGLIIGEYSYLALAFFVCII